MKARVVLARALAALAVYVVALGVSTRAPAQDRGGADDLGAHSTGARWFLDPAAAGRLSAALNGADEGLVLDDGLVLGSIRIAKYRVEFDVRAPTGGAPRTVVAVHAENGPEAAQGVELARADAVSLFGEPSLREAAPRSLQQLARAAAAAGWAFEDPTPPGVHVGGTQVSPFELGAVAGGSAGLALLLLAAWLSFAGARRLGWGPVGPRAAAGVVLLALGLVAVRVWLAPPGPANFVEIERRPLVEPSVATVYPFLVAPAAFLSPDTVAVQGLATLLLTVLGALSLISLGAAWGDRRAGWLAALALGLDPLVVHVSRTIDPGVAALGLVPPALLATEVAAATGRAREALAAALLWGLAFHLRPEHPALILLPVAGFLLDPRLRTAFRRLAFAAAFVLPLALSLAVDVAFSMRGPTVHYQGSLAGALAVALGALCDVLVGPLRPALFAALALVGLPVAPWRARVLAVLLLLLPEALVPLSGGWNDEIDGNWRYVVWGLPGLALLAGFGASALVALLARFVPRPATAPAGVLLISGLLGLVPLVHADAIAWMSPVQAEHAFLERNLDAVPPDAALLVRPSTEPGMPSATQAEYRLLAAGRRLEPARSPDAPTPADAAGRRFVYLQGWYEATHATREPALPATGVEWRARVVRSWRLVPLACTTFHLAPRTDGVPRWPVYCLLRLDPP